MRTGLRSDSPDLRLSRPSFGCPLGARSRPWLRYPVKPPPTPAVFRFSRPPVTLRKVMTPCNLNMKVWLIIVVSLGLIGAHAQTPQRKAVIGEVVSAGGKDLKIKTDQGATYTISTTDATSFLRIPPGEKDLKNASKIAFADINPGDRVLAQGPIADGATTVPATRVIVMTKADLAKKHERDREEWTTKGIAGTVDSVNPETKEITVKIRGIVPKT